MGLLVVISLYLGIFGLMLTSAGRQYNASVIMLIAVVLSLLGILRLFKGRGA